MCMMMTVRDKTKKDTYMCATLINMFKRGELRKDHPLQRKPDQWATEARNGFIVTVIKHEDVDSIKICEQINGEVVILWLIDGIQRLTTIEKFKKNLFSLGKNIEFPIVYYQVAKKDVKDNLEKDDEGNLVYDTMKFDLRGKYYKDLPDELQEKFDNYPTDVVKHLDCTDEEIGYHIRRYNRQTSMNANQSTITYMDLIAKYVKDISENNRFFADHGNYKETEKRKNIIDRVVTESVMAMFHLSNWKKGKSMGAYLNKESSKEEFDTYNEELDRLSKIIDQNTTGKLFNSKNSFVWFALFHRFVNLNIEDERFSDFLVAFMLELRKKKVEQFGNRSFDDLEQNRATKDKKTITEKINLLEALMIDFLHIDIEHGDCLVPSDIEFSKPDISILEFVKENVTGLEVCEKDVEQYEEVLDDLTLNVDNSSKLMDEQNKPSLTALVAYSFLQDINLDDWIVNFFRRNNAYIQDQGKNYQHMKNDLLSYVEMKTRALGKAY